MDSDGLFMIESISINSDAVLGVSVREGCGFEPELGHACFRKTHKLRTNRTNEYEDFMSLPTGTSWEVPLGSELCKFFAKT